MKCVLLMCLMLPVRACAQTCEAGAVWERMLNAKGGRAGLASVAALYERRIYTYWMGLRRVTSDSRSLYAYPDFMWGWVNENSKYIGSYAVTADYRARIMTKANDPSWLPRLATRPMPDGVEPTENQILTFLETRWAKPQLATCTVEPSGKLTLRAHLSGKQYVFVVWPDSYLVDRIVVEKGGAPEMYEMRDYTRVSGILLPTTIKFTHNKGTSTWRMEYEVNPQYDPQILTAVPSVEAGPDAWRHRRSR